MKLKILGTVSPFCSKTKNCPGYLIYNDNEKILLDCGNGISSSLFFPNELENLNIFISHMHKDHYGDLFSIGYASYVYHNLGLLKNKIKVFIPKFEGKGINDYKIVSDFEEKYYDILYYDENSEITINDKKITFQKNQHNINSYAIKIESNNYKLSYSGDTGYYKELEKFIFESDIFICETTFLKGEKNNNKYHLDTEDAAKLAINSKVRKLILTHFWPTQNKKNYLKEVKKKFKNVDIAVENKVYNCN